ncbi:MAG: hypothetical protein MUQ56_01690, partial [Thermoleophilia bacterium]|nr:hypothetical protein [Thermoleophilia bacterium]
MSLLIKNGTMVTAADEYRADVLVDGGKIIAIGGGLDDRTHGFETTAAAIVGGTTTVVDFAPQAAGLGLGDSAIKHDEEQAKGTHYLTLTVDNLAKPDFEGAKYVCSPPQRSRERLDVLWQSVSPGWLQVIGSDHCGFDWATQKHIGRDDFTEIPNGAPGVQYRMAVIWTHGVETGRITRQKFV